MSVLIFSEPVPVLWPLLLPLVAMFARGGMFHEEKETGQGFRLVASRNIQRGRSRPETQRISSVFRDNGEQDVRGSSPAVASYNAAMLEELGSKQI